MLKRKRIAMCFVLRALLRTKNEKLSTKSGFTLAELMIATTVLALIMTFSVAIYLNFFWSTRNLKAANLVYEEARFTMERIVKEVRNGTIDYEEYYNQNLVKGRISGSYDYILNDTYAQDYCQYSRQFYDYGPDGELGTLDDESIGKRRDSDSFTGEEVPPAIGEIDGLDSVPTPIQNNLYLININGDKRSYIKKIKKYDSNGTPIGKIGILNLIGGDFGVDHVNSLDPDLDPSTPGTCDADTGENDGRIDTWLCEDGHDCDEIDYTGLCLDAVAGHKIYGQNTFLNSATPEKSSFVDITPASLDIVDLKFFISPMDDPRKAYNDNSVQVQPHVTIKMTARANPKLTSQFKSGRTPDIVLESTVSTRAQNPIITECNLKQCTDGFSPDKACPLSSGVCGPNPSAIPPASDPATQICTNFVWTGCSTDTYTDYADAEWGVSAFGNSKSYQAGSEFESCAINDTTCIEGFCNDGMDNDCDGLVDEDDSECRFYLCNDGKYDIAVEGADGCKDVGGLCQFIRPVEAEETTCYDGYDNDCDGFADQFDSDCITQFCSNGKMDPDGEVVPNSDSPAYFLKLDYDEPDYLLNADSGDEATGVDSLDEICIDVGPLCPNEQTPVSEIDGCGGDATCERIKCSDGYDNDCDYNSSIPGTGADELDSDCQTVICNDTKQNCDLIDTGFDFASNDNISEGYLKNYSDLSCDNTDLDETCHNIGGICDGFMDDDGLIYSDHTSLNNENVRVGNSVITNGNIADLCQDTEDNDCDGLIDWEDEDCCPDTDNDGYIGPTLSGTNFCFPAPSALVDCNDSDVNINPDAGEVCDGAVYNSGPLIGEPIDNNCSFANDLTVSAYDSNDPECCVDVDGDGYGVADAYLSCTNSSAPDCDDGDIDINPGEFESIVSANCFNDIDINGDMFPINDNCNFTSSVPHANHLDWYADKDASWFTWYAGSDVEDFDISALSGESGIEAAHILGIYADGCCNSSAMEICDDVVNSDENCNGLEGDNDHLCITADDMEMRNYLSSGSGISLETANGVSQDINLGIVTLNMSSDVGMATSGTLSSLDLSSCNSSYDITLNTTDSEPDNTSIDYQVSSDGGATWCNEAGDCSSSTWATTTPFGITVDTASNPTFRNVRIRALLSGDDTNSSVPVFDDFTVSITNCS